MISVPQPNHIIMTQPLITRLFVLILALTAFTTAQAQHTFVVDYELDLADTNPGDGICDTAHSACTFRAAIEEANASANVGAAADTIRFGHFTQTNGYQQITLTAGLLPALVEKVFIDATTADAPIVVDGSGSFMNGIQLGAGSGGSVVRGLYLVNFGNSAVHITSNNNKIQHTVIGIFPDGTATSGGQYGIVIDGGNSNAIGGEDCGNVIGNVFIAGVQIENAIGTVVQGNFIGTDETGVQLGSQNRGVCACDGAVNTLIGGLTAAKGNTIGFSQSSLIAVDGAAGTVIQNNLLGTNTNGDYLGGVGVGIWVEHTDPALTPTLIGGLSDWGNTIGSMAHGIYIDRTEGHIIQGNFIGVTRTGQPVGNVRDGIMVTVPSLDITIGYGPLATIPAGAPKGNTIAYNGYTGITLAVDSTEIAKKIDMRGNSLFANTSHGIALHGGQLEPNDAVDGDAGNNRYQNHPVFAWAAINATNGKLKFRYSVPSLNFYAAYPLKVDVYVADDSTSGEGKRYLTTHTYTAATMMSEVSVAVDTTGMNLNPGDFLVATATDNVGNSSQFSLPVAIAFPSGGSRVAATADEMPGLSVEKAGSGEKVADALGAPYPNPFNPQTSFTLSLAEATHARIAIYDLIGRQVALLHDGELSASTHTFHFDGAGLATGVYLLRVQTQRFNETRRLILAK
ncbi:MAG: T9SS type A sorting domain-containing protein [Rhodothermales bacterium]